MTSILAPMVIFDEQRAINRLSILVAAIRSRLNERSKREWSREWLENALRQYLREGNLTIAEKAVETADKYDDEIADAALRDVGRELLMPMLQGRPLGPGHLQVVAYLQRAADRAPHKRKQGRFSWYDNWYRNHALCVLICETYVEFEKAQYGIRPSRSQDTRPSIISMFIAALARNQINLDETAFQKEVWFGLPGALVRKAFCDRWFFSVPV